VYKGKRIAVVIPAYNVAPQIVGVIQTVPEFIDNIIVERHPAPARIAIVTLNRPEKMNALSAGLWADRQTDV